MDLWVFEPGKRYREFRNLNGSRLYEQDGRLFLVISYDDIQDDEIDAFRNASFEVIFKTFGLVSLFTFRFRDYIVDAPFNQFLQCRKPGKAEGKEKSEIPMIIFIGESASGEVIARRETVLPQEFGRKLARLLTERDDEYSGQYNLEAFNEGIQEIYDNHVIEELYRLRGDREISCMIG